MNPTLPNNLSLVNKIILLVGIFLFSLFLRLYAVEYESMFMDEIRQVSYYQEPFSEVTKLAAEQQQPPLDYWIGHLFFQIDDSDFMARTPAIIFGSLSVALLALILIGFTHPIYAVLAATIYSLLPFNLYFSQEVRPYAISICLFLAYLALLVRYYPRQNLHYYQYGLLILVTTLFLLTRALAPLIMVCSSIFWFSMKTVIPFLIKGVKHKTATEVQHYFKIVISLGIACLLYLPFFLQLIQSGYSYNSSGASIDWQFFAAGFRDFDFVSIWQVFSVQTEPLTYLLLILIPIILLFIQYKKVQQPYLWGFGLFLLIFGLGLHGFIFFAKTDYDFRPPYSIYLLPLVFIVFFVPLGQINRQLLRENRKKLSMVIFILLLAMVVFVLPSSFDVFEKKTKTDWKGLSEEIAAHYSQGYLLIFKSILEKEMWEPGNYGAKRYQENFSQIPWLTVKYLQKHIHKYQFSNLKPALVFFQYSDYYLTNDSKYPFMKASYRRQDVAELLSSWSSEKLNIKHFNGLTLVELRKSSGSFSLDMTLLFNEILQGLPKDNIWLDMYHILAMSLAMCGSENYRSVVDLIGQTGGNELAQQATDEIVTLYSKAQEKNFSCFQ